MSTHAGIRIVSEDGSETPVSLYRNFDGYPSCILEKFREAYVAMSTPREAPHLIFQTRDSIRFMGRPSVIASWLCSVDPDEFEILDPEDMGTSYNYTLMVGRLSHLQSIKDVKWTVTIEGYTGIKVENMPLEEVVARIEEIEKED